MNIGFRPQSDQLLVTLCVFVCLFVGSTTFLRLKGSILLIYVTHRDNLVSFKLVW